MDSRATLLTPMGARGASVQQGGLAWTPTRSGPETRLRRFCIEREISESADQDSEVRTSDCHSWPIRGIRDCREFFIPLFLLDLVLLPHRFCCRPLRQTNRRRRFSR